MSAPCCEPTNKFLSNGCYLVETRRGEIRGDPVRVACIVSDQACCVTVDSNVPVENCPRGSPAETAMRESMLHALFVPKLVVRVD